MQANPGSATPTPRESPPQPEADSERLFNLSLDLLCIAGFDGYFKKVNPSWTRVLGWSREELLSRPIADFMHSDDRERTLQARANLAKGMPVRGLENRYLCKDGSYRWLSWQSSIDPGASTVFAVARDITEQRQRDQERLVLSKLESTGILAGGIAHDFNNLLASLLLNLEMVGMIGPVSAQQRQLLQQALAIVKSSQSLTQQLLTFAHGGRPLRKVVDLSPLLQQAMALALSGSTLHGECMLSADLWPVEIDEDQVGQAFRNLIINAREATPAGRGIQLRADNVTLQVSPKPELPAGDYVHIRVTDEGDGIPSDVLSKIFDPYFSTKQRGPQKGMGLGLTICMAVIQKHGGALHVESSPGTGTTVHCYLPAALKTPVLPPIPVSTNEVMPVGSLKILVMDDEQSLREIMAHTLAQIGYTAALAKDGEEAVALYEEARSSGHPFAAVLLDLTVRGGMGGGEAVRVLRQRDPSVRAVLMTGYNQDATLRDHSEHGFKAALAKPFSVENLRATLSEVLRMREN